MNIYYFLSADKRGEGKEDGVKKGLKKTHEVHIV